MDEPLHVILDALRLKLWIAMLCFRNQIVYPDAPHYWDDPLRFSMYYWNMFIVTGITSALITPIFDSE